MTIDCVLPYEAFTASQNYQHNSLNDVVLQILNDGCRVKSGCVSHIDSLLPWAGPDRTVSYTLQTFEPIDPLLQKYSYDKDQDCLEFALIYLEDWIKHYRPPSTQELNGNWREDEKVKDFLWYDMSVGLRGFRLAYLLDVIMLKSAKSPDYIDNLLEIIQDHKDYLTRNETFISVNNHGLYQALGQIAMSRRFLDLPGMEYCHKQGQDRLSYMLKQQFFEDGMHKEHSPGYHLILLKALKEAIHSKLITNTEQKNHIRKIEKSVEYFIKPNEMLSSFGDTVSTGAKESSYMTRRPSHVQLKKPLFHDISNPSVSGEMRLFPESGYAFIRKENRSPFLEQSYFSQQAGFHSRVHKHADHLTFEWFDKGKDIIVDSGYYSYKGRTKKGSNLWKQGFWYSDPKRIYVESTRAHNTIEVDGLDFPRQKIKPFGSALKRSAVSEDGIRCIESECYIFKSIRFNRTIFLNPNQFLIVLDWLNDNNGNPHDFKQWFHFGKELEIEVEGNSTLNILDNNKHFASVLSLVPSIYLDPPEKGKKEPSLNGWVSDDKGGSLIPNWAASFSAHQRSQTTFATLFSLCPKAKHWNTSFVAPSGQRGCLAWQDDLGCHRISFTKLINEDIKIKYRKNKKPLTMNLRDT